MSHRLVRILAVLAIVGVVSCGDDDPVPDAGKDAGKGTCGNGKIEGEELCDRTDLGGESCMTIGDGMFTGGTLTCTNSCTFNMSKCTGGDGGPDGMNDGGGGAGG